MRSCDTGQAGTRIAWACRGLCLAAYEYWLAHDDSDLLSLSDASFRRISAALDGPRA